MTNARMIDPAWEKRLFEGTRVLGVAPTTSESERLLRYLALLFKWNRAFNLTSVRDPLEMIDRHLIDSLAVLPYLQGDRILDMGTGPGLPGIPLSIMTPRKHFVLLDSNNKKIRFVRQVVLELGLKNVEPVYARVEELRLKSFDVLVSRAFTSLPRMLQLCDALLGPDAIILAMKGKVPSEELDQLPVEIDYKLYRFSAFPSGAERHLIKLTRKIPDESHG